MKRSVSAAFTVLACAGIASAQGFINAAYVGDGFAFSVGTPVYPSVVIPPAPAVVPAVIPLMPGYDYYDHYDKHMHKARKYARKAAEHYRKAVGRPAPVRTGAMISTPIGTVYLGTPARYDYDDDWDDDDYEDYYKHIRKKYKKAYKKAYKKYKKHHHHHHHDDD